MPNRCHLANKYEDTVNLQAAGHIMAAARLQLVMLVDWGFLARIGYTALRVI